MPVSQDILHPRKSGAPTQFLLGKCRSGALPTHWPLLLCIIPALFAYFLACHPYIFIFFIRYGRTWILVPRVFLRLLYKCSPSHARNLFQVFPTAFPVQYGDSAVARTWCGVTAVARITWLMDQAGLQREFCTANDERARPGNGAIVFDTSW